MGYEYLLTGLDELQLGQPQKLPFDQLLTFLEEQLSDKDRELLHLLQKTNDDPSIMQRMEDDDVLDRFHDTRLSEEDFREQLLYEEGMKSSNRFVRQWFEFNLNLNNVLAATVCLKHGYDVRQAIVGNNEVANLLRQDNILKNANLAVQLPELKDIITLADINDLMEREQHIDALRWQWIEDKTRFIYFSIENVLAYYLQAAILHRWDDLTREQGEQIFRAMLADMKRDVKF